MARTTGGVNKMATLRTQHNDALTQLKRYRLLVESVQDYAIFLLNTDGYVQTWNKGAIKIKGYKPEEIIGRHFSEFYLPRDKEAKKPERELSLAARLGRIEDEDWRVRKDGNKFWANVIITALHDESGELVGFAKVTRDLTERKQHEDELRDANILLKQQQLELERLNASKDEFISLASHQLRTPATGIKQYLGMLIEGFMGEMNSEQLFAVRKAFDSNERQLVIVNSLLKVAQLDAGRVKLQKCQVNIDELLRSIINDNAEKFASRKQQITVEVPETLPATIDSTHYRMALENLIDNASKYTPEGGNIMVSGKLDQGQLIVTVRDNGVGIAKEDIPKLFAKFARLPNELSDSAGGSGLGLYWAQKIILLHGGVIAVESPGKNNGTVFNITVPVD
jgi:PAS domain S-box-containing protein